MGNNVGVNKDFDNQGNCILKACKDKFHVYLSCNPNSGLGGLLVLSSFQTAIEWNNGAGTFKYLVFSI